MKKELQIAAKLNFDEFDKSVGDMQRKLKDMYSATNVQFQQMTTQNRAGSMGIPGMDNSNASRAAYRQQSQQMRRELDQSIASEIKNQRELSKEIMSRAPALKKMVEDHKKLVENTKEELELRKQIATVRENDAKQMHQFRQKDHDINHMMGMRDQMQPKGWERYQEAWKTGGLRGVRETVGQQMMNANPMSHVAMAGGVVSALGAGLGMAGDAWRWSSQRPLDTVTATGSAMNNTIGGEMANAYKGRSAIEYGFMPEKMKAAQMAADNMSHRRMQADLGLSGRILGEAGAGMAIGSLAGPLGAGALGAAGAIHAVTSTPGGMNQILAPFSQKAREGKQADLARSFGDDYQQALEGLKNSNPIKTMATEDYGQNYQRNLDFQRQAGLSNNQFYGHDTAKEHVRGYMDDSINAGFSATQAMGMSGQILGAGGSSSMARDPIAALQAQRAYGLNNAGSVMGKLSSTIGDSESSKKAFIEAIAEGQRRGLDSSQFAEENRKFMEAAASAVAGSGSSNKSDTDALTGRFGGFVNDRTTAGVSAAQSAFQMYTDQGSQTSGPRGVMRFANMRKDPILGRMGGMDQASAMALGDDQITEDNPVVQSLHRQYGKEGESVGDFVNALKKSGEGSRNRLAKTDQLQAKGKDLADRYSKETDPDKKADLQQQYQDTFQDLARQNMLERPELGKDQVKLKSYTSGMMGGLDEYGNTTAGDVSGKLGNKDTGRMEDQTVAANAEASRLILDNFVKMKDQLVTTSEQMANFNTALQKTVDIAQKMPKDQRDVILAPFTGLFNSQQTQAGSKGK